MTVTSKFTDGQPVVFSGTRAGLLMAVQMIGQHQLPAADITVCQEGTVVCLDYSRSVHAAGDVAVCAAALGMVVHEYAAETADGCAAVELRAQDYQDGILRTVRAVVPVPAAWSTP